MVGELASVPPESLERYLGMAAGQHLSGLSRAIDDRPVVPDQEAKSIGHEETFSSDLWELEELQRRLQRMVDASATALRTAERTARTAALLDSVDLSRGVRLLGINLTGFVEPGIGTQLRLDLEPAEPPLGDSVRTGAAVVHSPDGDPAGALRTAGLEAGRLQETWRSVTDAVDSIRARYGGAAVGPASLVTAEGIQVRQRGQAQWGPGGPDGPSGPESSGDALENRRERADNL
jgi:DNA polymerase-4